MDLISQYGSDDEDNNNNVTSTTASITPKVNLTPHVITTLVPATNTTSVLVSPYEKQIAFNAKYEDMYAPVYGPEDPYANSSNLASATVTSNTGQIESYTMNDYMFSKQLYSYGTNENKKKKKYKRSAGSSDLARPWSTFESETDNVQGVEDFDEDAFIYVDEKETEEEAEQRAQNEINQQIEEQEQQKKKQKTTEAPAQASDATEEAVQTEQGGYSVLHLEQERDYLGRTFIHPPSHLKPKSYRDLRAFLPKKWIHTWSGHTKAVTAIKFFPVYGHLILSASMDNTIKIWGTAEDNRVLIRTYHGHQKAIRGISFSSDGKQFASCSYDKTVKLWDTEYGKVIGTYTNGSIPFCAELHPSQHLGHQLLAGCQNKKIVQWDTRARKIVQKYERHLGAVNTITFLENNRQFLSSSDDKSLRLWDYGIPVEVKYIADPSMHSIPYIGKHPNGKWLLGQSLDNNILVYESGQQGFRQYKKKLFKGHRLGGYACACGFSNDGRFVYSGDVEGNVWFWDWKTGELLDTKKYHDDVCIGVAWHPLESSKVATCSWDGTIKYFD
jgi:pre-mRNA-processing factor 17